MASLERKSSRDSFKDQTDLVSDLSNAENQATMATYPTQDKKPPSIQKITNDEQNMIL